MFCRNCGMRLPDGTKFCDKCGANTDYYSTGMQTPVAAPPTPAPVAPAPAPTPAAKPKSSSSDEKYAEVFADIRKREFKKTVITPIVSIIVITALIFLITPSITGVRQSKAAVRKVMNALCNYDMQTVCWNCYAAPDGSVYSYYGTKHEVSYKIKSVEQLDEHDLEDLQDTFEYSNITAGTEVRVTITEHTDQGKNTDTITLIVLKVNTNWEVYYQSLNWELLSSDLTIWRLLTRS